MPSRTIGWLSQQGKSLVSFQSFRFVNQCYVLVQDLSFVSEQPEQPEQAWLALVYSPNELSWPKSDIRSQENYGLGPADDMEISLPLYGIAVKTAAFEASLSIMYRNDDRDRQHALSTHCRTENVHQQSRLDLGDMRDPARFCSPKRCGAAVDSVEMLPDRELANKARLESSARLGIDK